MKPIRYLISPTSKTAFLAIIFVQVLSSQNRLYLARTTPNSFEIRLENSDEVAGMQFSLKSSSGIAFGELARSERTRGSEWIVSSYKPNDSTINVVILNDRQSAFSRGQGPVATVSFHRRPTSKHKKNAIVFSNLLIANQQAESLGVAFTNLEWSGSRFDADRSDPFIFGPNYPNPFNPSTKLTYRLNNAAQVRLIIYDIMGREIVRLVDQYQFVGDFTVTWNSTDNFGRPVSSGMYFAQLKVDDQVITQRMILAK